MLKFSPANAKISALADVDSLAPYLEGGRDIYSLDLLSGWSCPFAHDCLARVFVDENGRRLEDGPATRFRCFSASQEVAYPSVYELRKHNFDLLRTLTDTNSIAALIQASMPLDMGVCRIHVAGDFYSEKYFLAWLAVAAANPHILFYAYTKSLRHWIRHIRKVNALKNFVLTASKGGREDILIEQYNLRTAEVVFSEEEAYNKKLEIDHDDSHAADPSKRGQSFALLIHGVQPAKSEASKALYTLRKKKVKHSYSR